MTDKQTFSLKYNKILFRAALGLLLIDLLYAAISFLPAVPLFFDLMKNHADMTGEQKDLLLSQKILLNPTRFQFLFVASVVLLIFCYFRKYSVPDKLHVRIPAKFYRPIDVKFNPAALFAQIEADPQYMKSMARLRDNKAYERKAKAAFWSTFFMLLAAYYFSGVLFKPHVLETLRRWSEPGGLLHSPMRLLFEKFDGRIDIWVMVLAGGPDVPLFVVSFFRTLFSSVIFFGIIYLIVNFIKRKEFKTGYIIQDYDRSLSLCKACGFACVDILEKTGSVETGREKTGERIAYVPYRTHTVTKTNSSGQTSTSVRGWDEHIYEYSIYKVTYRDSYRCRHCEDKTTRQRQTEEAGERRSAGTRFRSA
jgi:hypothetical protein